MVKRLPGELASRESDLIFDYYREFVGERVNLRLIFTFNHHSGKRLGP